MLDDDMAAIHTDLAGMGMADAVSYDPVSGATVAIIATLNEQAEQYLIDEGGEKRRRTCTLDVRRSQVALPVKGDRVTVLSGAFAGTWTVVDTGTADSGGWLLTVRLDDRVKAGTGRRLP